MKVKERSCMHTWGHGAYCYYYINSRLNVLRLRLESCLNILLKTAWIDTPATVAVSAQLPYFYSQRTIFVSQQISQQYFQSWLISQANRTFMPCLVQLI